MAIPETTAAELQWVYRMLRGQADYLQKHLVGIVTVHKLPEEFRDVCRTFIPSSSLWKVPTLAN